MSSFNVIVTFMNTRLIIPDEELLLPGIPSQGDILWTTHKFLNHESNENAWENAAAWEVHKVEMLLKYPHRLETLITVKPYRAIPAVQIDTDEAVKNSEDEGGG